MSYHKQKTPFMVSKERELMEFFLNQIKRWKGLTSTIEKVGGINGKWFNPNSPYEINTTKGIRLVWIKTAYQDEDEYIQDALEFREFVSKFREKYEISLDRKPKTRRKQ